MKKLKSMRLLAIESGKVTTLAKTTLIFAFVGVAITLIVTFMIQRNKDIDAEMRIDSTPGMQRNYEIEKEMDGTIIYTRAIEKGNTNTGTEFINIKYLGVKNAESLCFISHQGLFKDGEICFPKDYGLVIFSTSERRLVQFKVVRIEEKSIVLYPVWLGNEQYGKKER